MTVVRFFYARKSPAVGEGTYTLYGVEGSYYAAKVRSYFIQKSIPFEEVLADRTAFDEVILPRIGYPIVPIVITPDDTAIQDTAVIIEQLESKFRANPIIPENSEQHFVSRLLELYADEWLKISGLHYRWWYDADFAALMMGKNNDPTASHEQQLRVGRKISQTFRSWPQHLGATAHSKEAVEQLFLIYLDLLDKHFLDHPYILGEQPTLGDCALMGPLYAHGFHDPYSGAIMRERAPNVCAWITRMRRPPLVTPESNADLCISPTLVELLQIITRDYSPMITTAVETAQLFMSANDLADTDKPLPRYLGEQAFSLGLGEPFEIEEQRSVHTVEMWKFQRLIHVFSRFSPAEQETVLSLFPGSNLREMLNVKMPFRIEHNKFQLRLSPS